MSLKHPFYLVIIFISFSFIRCSNGFDDYSTNKNHILSFSNDTLSFDTILSTIGTSTHQFMVYNKNSDPLLISSVSLKNADRGFRMNVNGRKGDLVNDVRIDGNDSIYIFVEATHPEKGQNMPILIEDEIIFLTNGVQQRVVLQAYGQDVFIWRGVVLESSMEMPNIKPYLIFDSLQINEGVELIIQEGTTFYIHNNADIKVYGNIKAKGSNNKRITFRGDRTDGMFSNVSYDQIPRQWGGIYFASTSYNNEFEYVQIRNGKYGLSFELSDPEQSKLIMRNCIVTNVADTLFSAKNCFIEVENCEFSNSGGPLLYLNGGKYSFIHCTAANFMDSFWGQVKLTGNTLILANALLDSLGNISNPLPLLQADFYNSIVYGERFRSSYISISQPKGWNNYELNYKFENCLLSASGENDGDTIINCIFNEDPRFQVIDPDLKLYDFRLDSISPALNVANKNTSENIPYDLNGISRFMDEGPDIGAYERVKSE